MAVSMRANLHLEAERFEGLADNVEVDTVVRWRRPD